MVMFSECFGNYRTDRINDFLVTVAFTRFKAERNNRVLPLVLLKYRTFCNGQPVKQPAVFFSVFIGEEVV